MKAWIQKHTLESDDIRFDNAIDVIEFLKEYDWNNECSMMEIADYETCPAGLGLVADDETILHVCPSGDGTSAIHLHNYLRTRKIFGVLPLPTVKDKSWLCISPDKVNSMIEYFFRGNYDKIFELAEQVGGA